jgi:hypothetical protein
MTSGKENTCTQAPNYRRLSHGGKNITYGVNKNNTEDNSKNSSSGGILFRKVKYFS